MTEVGGKNEQAEPVSWVGLLSSRLVSSRLVSGSGFTECVTRSDNHSYMSG